MKKTSHGFTLIELMIVVAIMGVLSTMALPTYLSYTERTKVKESLVLIDTIKESVTAYYKRRKSFPANNAAAGVPKPEQIIGHYINRVDVDKGAIHIRFGNFVSPGLKDKILSLRPVTVKGSPASPISWACGWHPSPEGMQFVGENKTTVNKVLLPITCRG